MAITKLRLLVNLTFAVALITSVTNASKAETDGLVATTGDEEINVNEDDDKNSEANAYDFNRNVRNNFKLPKLFLFERFKMLHHKQYCSTVEEMLRMKVFLARSYQVFLSAVAYLYRLNSYYLKLGERSDWLPQELAMIRNKLIGVRDGEGELGETVVSKPPVELVEPEELEAELRKIREHASEPRYALLANELAKLEVEVEKHERMKRSLSSKTVPESSGSFPRTRSDFDISAAFSKPVEQPPDEVGSTAKSNNPSWEPPELDTRGAGGDSSDFDNYRKVVEKEVKRGPSRTYDHLPVKGRYKKTGVVSWLTNNFLNNALGSSLQLASSWSSWLSGPRASVSSDQINGDQLEQLEDVVWVDHSNCLPPVQDQGRCSSCYAFTMMAFLEWAHCMETGGELVKFSEQYLVDCGLLTDKFLIGCGGGDITSSTEFVANFGLELASHYPYTARDGACPYHPKTEHASMGYIRVDKLTQVLNVGLEYAEHYLKLAPMAVVIYAGGNFAYYGGGVYDGKDCDSHSADHLVLLIGHGREEGEEYWLIRNSYGVNWGEDGYMKLNKNSDCIHQRKGKIFKTALPNDIRLDLSKNERRDFSKQPH